MKQLEDSPLRCPRDGKRMVVDLGPADDLPDLVETFHTCLHCGYTAWDEWLPRGEVRALARQHRKTVKVTPAADISSDQAVAS